MGRGPSIEGRKNAEDARRAKVFTKLIREITIASIMKAAEEETRMTRCMGEEGVGCLGEENCLTHNLWQALGDRIRSFLDNVSLQDVLDGMPKQRAAAAAGAQAGA